MGQKVSPVGLRIGVNKSWQSNWYAEGKLNAKYIKNDDKIRKMLEKKLKDASVSSILIERDTKKTNVVINTAKPGVVIGHGGDEIEKLKKELTKLVDENISGSGKNLTLVPVLLVLSFFVYGISTTPPSLKRIKCS